MQSIYINRIRRKSRDFDEGRWKKRRDLKGEVGKQTTARFSRSLLELIVYRAVDVRSALDYYPWLRDVRRAAHRGQRNPRRRSSRRCVIVLRNAS